MYLGYQHIFTVSCTIFAHRVAIYDIRYPNLLSLLRLLLLLHLFYIYASRFAGILPYTVLIKHNTAVYYNVFNPPLLTYYFALERTFINVIWTCGLAHLLVHVYETSLKSNTLPNSLRPQRAISHAKCKPDVTALIGCNCGKDVV